MSSERACGIAASGTFLAVGLLLLGLAVPAPATVFYARDEALEIAFPDAERTETRNFFLTAAQRETIERKAKSKLESDLLTVYVGWRENELVGYALLDTHLVRTLPETFMVVLSPNGSVASTHVLAFHEPLEYLPGERWLRQFDGRMLEDGLQVGRGVAAITGSTLTSRAVVGGVRRALAIHEVLLKGE